MIPLTPPGNNGNIRISVAQTDGGSAPRVSRQSNPCAGAGPNGSCAFQTWSAALGLSAPVCARMAPLWRSNVYRRGDVIFYQGNDPTSIYFLCHGSVKLVRDARMGRQHILRMINGPDFLGDRAMLAGQPYAASAQVMEESRVCAIDGQSFRALWRDEPELSRMLAIYLARKLAEADVAACDLALLTIRELLARLIAGRLGPGSDGVVRFSESRQDLADILGTSAEVISRTLSEFARKKLVELDGRNLRVLDEERLRLIAGVPPRRADEPAGGLRVAPASGKTSPRAAAQGASSRALKLKKKGA